MLETDCGDSVADKNFRLLLQVQTGLKGISEHKISPPSARSIRQSL